MTLNSVKVSLTTLYIEENKRTKREEINVSTFLSRIFSITKTTSYVYNLLCVQPSMCKTCDKKVIRSSFNKTCFRAPNKFKGSVYQLWLWNCVKLISLSSYQQFDRNYIHQRQNAQEVSFAHGRNSSILFYYEVRK